MVQPAFFFRRKAHSIQRRSSTDQQSSFARIRPLRSISGSIRRRQDSSVQTTSFKSAPRRKTPAGTQRPARLPRRVFSCCSRRPTANRWRPFRRDLDYARLLGAQGCLHSSSLEAVCCGLIAKRVSNLFFTGDQALTLPSARKEK